MTTTEDRTINGVTLPAQEVPAGVISDDTAPGTDVAAVPAEVAPAAVPPVYADITTGPGERGKIIPACVDGWANARETAKRYAGRKWHQARFHGFRLPWLYLPLWAGCFIRGLFRITRDLQRWVSHAEAAPLRSHAVITKDSREYLKQSKERDEKFKVRGIGLAAGLVVLAAGLAALAKAGPWWALPLATATGAVLVVWYGRPAEGKRLIQPAVIPAQYVAPTQDVILFALGSLGIPLLTRAVKEGTIAPFIVGRDGPGWGAQIILPHGVTATDVMTKRAALSSGLRRPLSAVWPAKGDEHEGHLDLWIGFQDLSKATRPPWPLLKAGQGNVFDALPFGADPRGRPVSVPMFEINWLIGAAPGQGKTAAVRVLACGVALDPLADIWIHELANKGDLEPFTKIAHRYVSGNDEETLAYAAESARLLRAEYARRSAAFKQVPKEKRLEGKITRELAKRRQFRPLVAIFDEIQNLLTDPEHGKQAAEDLAYVIRLGRALGIIIVLSTQRPDAQMIPSAVTGNILGRFCLMVPGQVENDMVLGTSAYRRGYDATNFRPKQDAGLGWLKGSEDGVPQVIKTYYLDLKATEKVVKRAQAQRIADGTLTGYALGEVDEAEARDLLADGLSVLVPAETGCHKDPMAQRLVERYPDRYAGVTGASLSRDFDALGVPCVPVSMSDQEKRTGRGSRRQDIEAAIEKRAAGVPS